VDCQLGPADYDKFSPGKLQTEVLNDIQWRGNFEFAADFDGKNATAISYDLFGGPFRDNGTSVLAVFVDGKFIKFVHWPEYDPKIKIGDFSILKQVVESDPVSIADLEKEKAEKPKTPERIDPGLTATWLLYRKGLEATRAPMLRRNAVLRDQFNAARLKIGMRATDVEAVFNAKPIRSGIVEGGSFQIYGSTESFDVLSDLHYSNVLVVLRDDKVTGIYSGGLVPGGYRHQEMQQWFIDLPEQGDK
jgi:hypothetical protein